MLVDWVWTRIRNEFFIRDEFDKIHGTETSRYVGKFRLGVGAAAVCYQATSPQSIAKAFSALPPEAKTYPFYDLGCGKGRALILAQEFGFHNIVGVELSKKVLATCRRNLSLLGITNVTVIEEDAANVIFPDSPIVVYMYHPFRPPVLDKVIDRIEGHSHPLFLIYANPVYRSLIEESGRSETILDLPDLLVAKLSIHAAGAAESMPWPRLETSKIAEA